MQSLLTTVLLLSFLTRRQHLGWMVQRCQQEGSAPLTGGADTPEKGKTSAPQKLQFRAREDVPIGWRSYFSLRKY